MLKHVSIGFDNSKNGDFDLKDKKTFRSTKNVRRCRITLSDENSARTLEELVEALNIGKSIVFDRLYAMENIQKEDKWVPHELAIQNRLTICTSLISRHKKKQFCIKL